MTAINTMIDELLAARGTLMAEIRASDDATDARVDALLAVPLEERLAAREAAIRAALAAAVPDMGTARADLLAAARLLVAVNAEGCPASGYQGGYKIGTAR